jgi:hypothetical protein
MTSKPVKTPDTPCLLFFFLPPVQPSPLHPPPPHLTHHHASVSSLNSPQPKAENTTSNQARHPTPSLSTLPAPTAQPCTSRQPPTGPKPAGGRQVRHGAAPAPTARLGSVLTAVQHHHGLRAAVGHLAGHRAEYPLQQRGVVVVRQHHRRGAQLLGLAADRTHRGARVQNRSGCWRLGMGVHGGAAGGWQVSAAYLPTRHGVSWSPVQEHNPRCPHTRAQNQSMHAQSLKAELYCSAGGEAPPADGITDGGHRILSVLHQDVKRVPRAGLYRPPTQQHTQSPHYQHGRPGMRAYHARVCGAGMCAASAARPEVPQDMRPVQAVASCTLSISSLYRLA